MMAEPQIPKQLQSLLDIYQHPFVLVDRDYNIVAANKAYAGQYGLPAGAIVGRKCHQVSHHSDKPCREAGEDCPLRRMFASKQVEEAVHLHTRTDGRKECVEIKAHPILGDGGEVLYMGEHLRPIAMEDALVKENMVGHSPAFLTAVHEATLLAPSDLPVVITGETGVGKEVFAAFVHKHSARVGGPFVTLDCCGLSETLFESELFGHEAGAFTGAQRQKRGLFEQADGGTLFLDEIGEISLTLQAKLLRVIETGHFRRVGGTQQLKANVRIVSATNRDLREMIAQGTFRLDLYFRLSGHTLAVPPLRARKTDIPALLCFFMHQQGYHLAPTSEAMRLLEDYSYPGNIRELKHIVELAALKAGDGMLRPEHLPEAVLRQDGAWWHTPPRSRQRGGRPARCAARGLRVGRAARVGALCADGDPEGARNADALQRVAAPGGTRTGHQRAQDIPAAQALRADGTQGPGALSDSAAS